MSAESVQDCVFYLIPLSIHVPPLLKKGAGAAGDSSCYMVGCCGTTLIPDLDDGFNQVGVILVEVVYHLKGLLGSSDSDHLLI